MATAVYQHAPPVASEVRHKIDSSARWGTRAQPPHVVLTTYFEALDALDLHDPTGAREHHSTSLELLEQSRQVRDSGTSSRRDLASDLATGQMTPTAALKALSSDKSDAKAEEAREQAALLHDAARRAWANALDALHHGADQLITDHLAPLVADALERPDGEPIWNLAHDLTSHLRRYGLAGALDPPGRGRGADLPYRFARPDWVYLHLVDVGGYGGTPRATWESKEGSRHVEPKIANGTPDPTWQEIREHPEWGAGIFTAAQAVANGKAQEPRRTR